MENQRYLLIDTETSGLFDFARAADGMEQGRLAQLAMIECESAPDFEITRKFDAYVKPDGWLMSPDATRVNGLTIEFLEKNGIPVGEVLDAYVDSISSGRAVLAYGARFDMKCLRGELRRADRGDLFEQTPNLCLMIAMTAICAIPRRNGRGLKWPKLEEAMAHFDLPFEGAHDARNDVFAAYQLMCKLNELGELPEARVYHARNFLAEEESV